VVFHHLLSKLVVQPLRRALLRPALTSQCAVCRSWPATQVCASCISRFSQPVFRCTGCALALPQSLFPDTATSKATRCAVCIKKAPPLDETRAALEYAYPWSQLITRYKFGDQPGWAPFFAEQMLAAPGVKQVFEALHSADFIVPIPLSPERLQLRGFNQAWELARALARQSCTAGAADAGLLLRVKHTRAQTELQRHARLENVKDAFQVEPLRAASLKGSRIILVDDVMTSGASIYTAAQTLRAAGASHITAVVLARTPFP